jgi:Carboxypeptidase regulatory-like domain/TonB-dependent Receptor Plug Domain
MLGSCKKKSLYAALVIIFCLCVASIGKAQSSNSTSVTGTVLDPSGAVVPGATVDLRNPVSGFERTTVTGSDGKFSIPNVPFNPYHVTVTRQGFAPNVQDVEVRSTVPVNLQVSLGVEAAATSVTVEASAEDLLENTSTFHTDVDRGLFDKIPLESQSSSVSSLVTLATPGIAADSNGLFHGLGDHAENSFSVDGQPITDQQSKVFSNQIPIDSIESMEVIAGAPPAEYGDKTSVVIDVTTRSGQGVTTPHGSVTGSYGSFGTSNAGFTLSYGGKNWGNFIAANGLNTGRFLDPPEFAVVHDRGNEENLFDRVDYSLSGTDSIHVNFGFTRSWFQNPNSFDAQNATAWSGVVVSNGGLGPDGLPVGPTDQRSQIKTFNIAPSWTRTLSNNAVFTLGGFVRRDHYNYYPSRNPFADLQPIGLQEETVGQDRTLLNAGIRSNISYVKGPHNVKAGVTYEHTFLDENDSLGIVDPTFLASTFGCPNGAPAPDPCAALPPFDLTSGGTLFPFHGHTDVKELALYLQDTITKGPWSLNLGIRGDFYNGLVTHKEAEPRLGVAYNIKRTNTVLRVSYARVLETPFNENLVLSSVGCADQVLNPLLGCTAPFATPLAPGWRNEFHAGLEQAFGKYLVFSGEYIWKYTHHGYDFSVLGNTPIAFPVAWERSKIPGFAGRVSVPNYHGFTALVVFSSVAARFFTPQVGGAGATPSAAAGVFRIDHDEKFNETTHIQYQAPRKWAPWVGFNWRYDSGLVAGPVPCAGGNCNNGPSGTDRVVDTSIISPDQQFQAGLFCGSVFATPLAPIGSGLGPNLCPASQYGSKFISVPAPGTEDDDHNPPRIAPRHLFDLALGHDNIFGGDRFKVGLQFSVVNLTNKTALYNFLSTFSGTHYVTPRAYTAQVAFHF